MTASITADELKNTLARNKELCVLDVRRMADYQNSPATIPGAVWLDPEKIGEWSKTLPREQELVVYCVRGGSVSQSVAKALQESHPGVRFLEGGMVAWQERQG